MSYGHTLLVAFRQPPGSRLWALQPKTRPALGRPSSCEKMGSASILLCMPRSATLTAKNCERYRTNCIDALHTAVIDA